MSRKFFSRYHEILPGTFFIIEPQGSLSLPNIPSQLFYLIHQEVSLSHQHSVRHLNLSSQNIKTMHKLWEFYQTSEFLELIFPSIFLLSKSFTKSNPIQKLLNKKYRQIFEVHSPILLTRLSICNVTSVGETCWSFKIGLVKFPENITRET